MSAEPPLNVIIPMGGLGSRFQKEGYRFSKPMVNIVGRPMILWVIDNLNFKENDILWIAHNDYMEQDLRSLIKKEYPKLDVRPVILSTQTRGAAETLFAVLQRFSFAELSNRVISLDCDSFYFEDVLTKFRMLGEHELDAKHHKTKNFGACFYFEDRSVHPVYSYIDFDSNESKVITQIKEKVRITNHANTGAYGFPSGFSLKEHCSRVLDSGVGVKGEYYTSNVIAHMIEDGYKFKGVEVREELFVCVGTPLQLQSFLERLKQKKLPAEIQVRKMRFCFDLDNTLVTFPLEHGDYTSCQPRLENIKILQDLYDAGHTIIIQTARRMKTHKGNVGAILADIGPLTFEQLSNFNIPYHEVHFGKPHAHVYVDDLAVNALLDTAKEIGWCSEFESRRLHDSMVEARSFNQVVRMGDAIVKTMSGMGGRGEAFYYSNAPESVKHLFPELVSVQELPDHVTSLSIGYVQSTSFAQLSSICCITQGRMRALFESLHQLHNAAGDDVPEPPPLDVAMENYSAKLKKRFQGSVPLYEEIAELVNEGYKPSPKFDVHAFFDRLYRVTVEYEESDRPDVRPCIHGDPVFSNVLITPSGNIKLVDMRGLQGKLLTLGGDLVYDLAKVIQSLCGYDFVLLNKSPPSEQEEEYLKDLLEGCFGLMKELYPTVTPFDVMTITTTHLFSLIPLHESKAVQTWALHKAYSLFKMVNDLSAMRAAF